MAQWSRPDRTLYTKLVYYGPAFGGKTTNLQILHRITDPRGRQKLLQVKTADDRTLFFDLLPFDLGDILGYQVAMKLYTVPGQVRYDTTRQVVLAGTDAVIFVADSTPQRREQNAWSLQDLYRNMRARRLDPSGLPVVFQFNKQDLPEAAPPEEVASWLGLQSGQHRFAAVAIEAQGVLETFMAACRVMLERLVSLADERTRRELDAAALSRHIERAFGPYLVRQGQCAGPQQREAAPADADTSIVLPADELLERSLETNVRLGEKLTSEAARAGRLEREAEAFRRLSESLRDVGASFDRRRIIEAALAAVAEVLRLPAVTLVLGSDGGTPELEGVWGRPDEPLLGAAGGSALLRRMLGAAGACVVEDLSVECGAAGGLKRLDGLRAAAAVPVEPSGARILVAYAPQPDGSFDPQDVRFLATVAGHLAAGLEKSRLHEELAAQRDGLEEVVAARTLQLREAYEELRGLERMKDRFLGNLSHEMRTPLTAVLTAAHVLREYQSSATERQELLGSIVNSAQTLQQQLDHLLRLVHLESSARPLEFAATPADELLREAVRLADQPAVRLQIDGPPAPLRVDAPRFARCVANLIDNAFKFSPAGSPVEVRLGRGQLATDLGPIEGTVVSVLDRGPGVALEDRQRIFSLFEQGGDPLTGKPAGIGVGLYEAASIARRHGGTLEYRVREEGGSEFRLTIPLHPTAVAMNEPARV